MEVRRRREGGRRKDKEERKRERRKKRMRSCKKRDNKESLCSKGRGGARQGRRQEDRKLER